MPKCLGYATAAAEDPKDSANAVFTISLLPYEAGDIAFVFRQKIEAGGTPSDVKLWLGYHEFFSALASVYGPADAEKAMAEFDRGEH